MNESPIEFDCPTCGKSLKVKARGAGRTINCPGCQQPTVVPTPQTEEPVADDPFGFRALGGLDESPEVDDLPPPEPPAIANPYSTPAVDAEPQRQDLPWETALPAKRSYPALNFISQLYRVSAYIIAGLALIGFVLGLVLMIVISARTGEWMTVAGFGVTAVPMTLGALLVAVFMVMNAELIQLGINIQENTLATAHASRRAAT